MGDALHTHGGVTDAHEARLAQAGLIAVVGPSALDTRTGVLHGPGSTALVTGTGSTAPMQYAVAPHQWVTSRGAANGPYLGALEATQLVDTTAAPPSGQSRIDVIWEKQGDATPGVPSPDAATAPQYGCTQGNPTTGTPAKPPIPVGAEELATAVVSAGATATNGAGVTITPTARQTVARGAPIPVRNKAERDALTGFDGLTVRRLDIGQTETYRGTPGSGGGWDEGAWQDYIPGLLGITLGNGTRSGRYRQNGKTVHYWAQVTWGSTTTVSGNVGLGRPVPGESSNLAVVGQAYMTDASASGLAARMIGVAVPQGATNVEVISASGGRSWADFPWVWAVGDVLRVAGTYEAS